jgi:ribosomal protein S18 acetylase RimI-like enzyme
MVEILIRKAAEQDLSSLLSMPIKLATHLSNSYDKTIKPEWFLSNDAKEFYFEFLHDTNKCVYVAETLGGEIIGFVAGELADATEYWYRKINCFASLDELFVLEEYRSSGVGKKLMNQFKDWCREKGADRISLEVSTTNVPAILFYQKHGFDSQYTVMEMVLGEKKENTEEIKTAQKETQKIATN